MNPRSLLILRYLLIEYACAMYQVYSLTSRHIPCYLGAPLLFGRS